MEKLTLQFNSTGYRLAARGETARPFRKRFSDWFRRHETAVQPAANGLELLEREADRIRLQSRHWLM